MAAAVDVAEAAGLDRHSDPLIGTATRRRTCPARCAGSATAACSASDLHRACGADIARGSMRLWSQACGSLPGEPPEDWR